MALSVVAFVVFTEEEAQAEEIRLEPVAAPVPDPFTQTVTGDSERPPSPEVTRVATAPGAGAAGQQVPGATPGLYGGTRNEAVCDAEQLAAFLDADPAKARAWARVAGIEPSAIGDYVAGLTPVVLTRDTRVTNHGYSDGKATDIPAVLQAGTAVLVDGDGIPRVKCGCGNPLTEPTPLTPRSSFRGTRWAGFSETTVVVVTVTVRVEVFVLVDLAGTGLFTRPPGTTGPADGSLSPDELCDLFPDDPACEATTTTSTTTSTTTTTIPTTTSPPPTRPPTLPPTTAPPTQGGREGEAVWWIQEAIGACDPTSFEVITDIRALPTERDTLYVVDVALSLDSGSWTAAFEVDFATEEFPEIRPADAESAALICMGTGY